eukprot:TRINITY_DN95721_c0_g1_i1.p1 TRINITY_DN95721_c0_g1~~TRINITY_DN95721_c0_g1_i1.p1  ORF type:complete len:109 (+),score=20.52 TRINITY_DN95721_c0_g1_i1:220-546(+)
MDEAREKPPKQGCTDAEQAGHKIKVTLREKDVIVCFNLLLKMFLQAHQQVRDLTGCVFQTWLVQSMLILVEEVDGTGKNFAIIAEKKKQKGRRATGRSRRNETKRFQR